jgi:hypothetical protein
MVIAASRRTTSITTGSGFGVAAASSAGGPSPSCRCFHSLTPITAWWRAARHCSGALWSTVRGREQCRSSRMRIAYRIPPRFAAGRRAWIVLSRHFRFCLTLWLAWLTSWSVVTLALREQHRCPGSSRLSKPSGPCAYKKIRSALFWVDVTEHYALIVIHSTHTN